MATREMLDVVLFMLDAGGGHRAAARALEEAARRSGSPLRFRIVNAQDALARFDVTRRLTGLPLEHTYNGMVRRGRTRHLVPLLRLLQTSLRLLRRPMAREVARVMDGTRADLVVSVIPNLNGVLQAAARMAWPQAPFVVALTDYADFPPRFWMEPGLQHVVVATPEAAAQARSLGVPNIHTTSGMILHPRHYPRRTDASRRRVRAELAVREHERVALVLFGGKGAPEIVPITRTLLAQPERWRVVAICGDNPAVYDALAGDEAASGGRLRRLGFTEGVAELMAASDVLVTKPGPGSVAEALHHAVIPVVCGDACTIPQERFNVRMLRERGLGVAVDDVPALAPAAATLLRDETRQQQMRARLRALPENVAVFEMLALLERLAGGVSAAPAVSTRDLATGT